MCDSSHYCWWGSNERWILFVWDQLWLCSGCESIMKGTLIEDHGMNDMWLRERLFVDRVGVQVIWDDVLSWMGPHWTIMFVFRAIVPMFGGLLCSWVRRCLRVWAREDCGLLSGANWTHTNLKGESSGGVSLRSSSLEFGWPHKVILREWIIELLFFGVMALSLWSHFHSVDFSTLKKCET